MAEAIGLAASIVQIANTGTKLSVTLYDFISSAARANQEIADIASDVQITANALDSVGEVFKDEDSTSIISKKAIQDARSLILRCEVVFQEIHELIDKRRKGSNKRRKLSEDGSRSLSVLGKFSWPLKEQRVQLLRGRLESLKNSLILLLHVIQLANDQTKGKLQVIAMREEREKIRQLFQREQESLKTIQILESKLSGASLNDEETLQGSNPVSRTSTNDDASQETVELGKRDGAQSDGLSVMAAASTPAPTNDDWDISDSEGPVTDEVTEQLTKEELSKCANHIQQLLNKIQVLQRSFECSTAPVQRSKRRVHQLYRRFCRNFEADLFPTAPSRLPSAMISLTPPSEPVPALRPIHVERRHASLFKIDSSAKLYKKRAVMTKVRGKAMTWDSEGERPTIARTETGGRRLSQESTGEGQDIVDMLLEQWTVVPRTSGESQEDAVLDPPNKSSWKSVVGI